MYDAIYLASDELMSKQQGRKALIILSDGVDRGSKETLTEVVVATAETVDRIYAEIEEELRNQYSLGYSPDKDSGSGYHKIRLTTKNKDLVVQARDAYYSSSK